MRKTIMLKEIQSGLLINFDPTEIDIDELNISSEGPNMVSIKLGDSYEVTQVKSKKEAEAALVSIKETIERLRIDNEEDAAIEVATKSTLSNPNVDKIINALGKIVDIFSPILENEQIMNELQTMIKDDISIKTNIELDTESEESNTDFSEFTEEERQDLMKVEEQVKETGKKVPLVEIEEEEQTPSSVIVTGELIF